MNSTAELPYELHTHGSGAFVIFNVTEQIALPLIAMIRATLRANGDGDEIILEFQTAEVVITGRGLTLLLEHLLAGRVKRISRASDAVCDVAGIRFTESQ